MTQSIHDVRGMGNLLAAATNRLARIAEAEGYFVTMKVEYREGKPRLQLDIEEMEPSNERGR